MKFLFSLLFAIGLMICLLSVAKADPSIYGGNIAERQPYMVRVAARCGGFLLDMNSFTSTIDMGSTRYVVTARHCLDDLDWNNLHVRIGEYSLSDYDGEQVITVTNVLTTIESDDFVRSDMVILELNRIVYRVISGTDIIVDFIGLGDTLPVPGTICHLYGWGKDGQEIREPRLKVVTQTVFSTEWYGLYTQPLDKNSFPGIGDSGGPLVCDGLVYGVLSVSNQMFSGYAPVYQYHREISEALTVRDWRYYHRLYFPVIFNPQ